MSLYCAYFVCLAYKPILSKLSKCQRLCSTPAILATDSPSVTHRSAAYFRRFHSANYFPHSAFSQITNTLSVPETLTVVFGIYFADNMRAVKYHYGSLSVRIKVLAFFTSNLFLLPDLSVPTTDASSSISIAAAIFTVFIPLERLRNSIFIQLFGAVQWLQRAREHITCVVNVVNFSHKDEINV